MRTILISIPIGRYCRILTLSGVSDLLLQQPDMRLVILSPAAHLEEFRSRIGLNGNVLYDDLPDYTPEQNLLQRLLRKMLLASWRHKSIFLIFMRLYELVQTMQEPRRFISRSLSSGCGAVIRKVSNANGRVFMERIGCLHTAPRMRSGGLQS